MLMSHLMIFTLSRKAFKSKNNFRKFLWWTRFGNSRNFETFIDESIYIAKATFTRIEQIGDDNFIIDKENFFELEPCMSKSLVLYTNQNLKQK